MECSPSMVVEETKDSVTYWVDFIILWLPENIDNLK